MLYWICPECGHECSPAIRECPTCTSATENAPEAAAPVQKQSDVSQAMVALAENLKTEQAESVAEPVKAAALQAESVLSANGQAKNAVNSAVIAPEEPILDAEIDTFVRPLVASVETVAPDPPIATGLEQLAGAKPQTAPAIEPKKQSPTNRSFPPASTPALIAAPTERPETNLALGNLVSLGIPSALEDEELPVLDAAARCLPARAAKPVFACAQVTVASEPLAEPAYDNEIVDEALEHQAKAVSEAIAEKAPSADPGLAFSEALQLQAEEVVDEIDQQLRIEEAGIQRVAATFHEQPTTCLLAAASEIVTAPAPPAVQWLRTPRPSIRPSVPRDSASSLMTGGPHPPTLPGPCLPAQLKHFVESPASSREPSRKPLSFPTLLVSGLVATCLFLGAGTVVQYVSSNREAKAASATATTAQANPAAVTAPVPVLPVVQEHPAARFVEVAGVRVINGANRKPQLQYIVINHSSSELTGLDVRIAGRAADAASGATPLFSISSVIPALGAYQSKEIRTDLDPGVRTAVVPEWQALRTEVLIARH